MASVVGAGIVGLPWVFTQAGFWLGLIELVLCCSLTHYSIKMLIDTGIAHGHQKSTPPAHYRRFNSFFSRAPKLKWWSIKL